MNEHMVEVVVEHIIKVMMVVQEVVVPLIMKEGQ